MSNDSSVQEVPSAYGTSQEETVLELYVDLMMGGYTVPVFFSKKVFKKWFNKMCYAYFKNLSVEIASDGFVSGEQMNVTEVSHPAPESNSYECRIIPGKSRSLVCERLQTSDDCRDPTFLCFSDEECYTGQFSITWKRTQKPYLDPSETLDGLCDGTCCCHPPFGPTPVPEWGADPEGFGGPEPTDPRTTPEDGDGDGDLYRQTTKERKKETDDQDPETYIYIGVGVGVSGVLLALTVIVIVCCVVKRRGSEKEKAAAAAGMQGVANGGFGPVVQATRQNSLEAESDHTGVSIVSREAEGGTSSPSAQPITENESHYDYIDDAYFAHGAGYSMLSDETKYNHEYNPLYRSQTAPDFSLITLNRVVDSNYRYKSDTGYEKPFDYHRSGNRFSDGNGHERYVITPRSIRPAPPPTVRGGVRGNQHALRDVYTTPIHQDVTNHAPSAFSPTTPHPGIDGNAPNSYLDLSFNPALDLNHAHLQGGRVVDSRGQRFRPLSEEAPPLNPYHAYLEVLAPLAPPPRGQGRVSLPPIPATSIVDSLGPQPPLPRRQPTFHYYSQPERPGPAFIDE
ncbi:uncharacterized protein LOC106012345 [Aplysia californica]|uniref:Uncharacterized protein LOC106012345 n=1 Tax=Aplysia californica TaxID=6500 RepID=A0ABM1A486_APLCA|nr:uncharacterized protein LOC106012345 [Aplysia californica]